MLDQCVHSRNLYPFFNSGEDSGKYNFIAKHLESCDECQVKFLSLKKSGDQLSALVPRVEISQDLQVTFDLEIKNIIEKSYKKKEDVEKFSFIPPFVKDIFVALTSRSLVRAYFFFGIYLFVVKSFSL